MGGQLSSGGGAASPGASSLGSHGQKGGATPRSASDRSLCSSSASSSFHSSLRLRALSPPPPPEALPPLLHFRSDAFGGSPSPSPEDSMHYFSAKDHHHRHNSSGRNSLSRWQSFARALPNLMIGGGGKSGGEFGKVGRMGAGKRHLAGYGNGTRRTAQQQMLDMNNNNSDAAISRHGHFSAPFSASSNFTTPRSIYSGDEAEDEADEEDSGRMRSYFSLKASLKKSGSRLFNSIIRNGYLRALMSDEETEEESEEELEEEEPRKMREIDEDRRERWVEEPSQFGRKLHNDENNFGAFPDNNNHHHQIPSLFLDSNNNNSKFRDRATLFQHPPQNLHLPTTKSGGLRSSLRNCKRHLMGQPKGAPEGTNGNGNGGNGMVSSMLLTMAAGRPLTSDGPRPLSWPENANNTGLDWNGNCAEESGGEKQQQRHRGGGAMLASPGTDSLMFSRKKVIQASSTELMRALGCFIGVRCCRLCPQFEPVLLTTWLRGVDRALILQGWQDVAFINPANLVFLFLLVRDSFARGESTRLRSLDELHSFVLLCLYISYSYMGNEISYPLKPFITEHTNRVHFWSHCVRLIKCHSAQMLRLNSSSAFFLEVFTELKSHSADHAIDLAYP